LWEKKIFRSQLTDVHDEGVMKVHDVSKWYKKFENGGLNIHYDERTSRSSISMTDVGSARASELGLNNRVAEI